MPERVWDPFLTQQDHAHLAMSNHGRIGFGEKPALLLVDLYRWVFGDRPEPLLQSVKTWPGSCGLAAWDARPHLQTVLKASRDAGIPIVHMTGLDHAGINTWTAHREPSGPADMSPEAIDRRNRRNDIIDEVARGQMGAVLLGKKGVPYSFRHVAPPSIRCRLDRHRTAGWP